MSYGFRATVSTYGCYDVNGYRFRSEKYERAKTGLTTKNSGVCVNSVGEGNELIEYYGVIEDIIKISWEGSMQLQLVLFDCRWFDPTSAGVRRTENLGLVEINHNSRLSNFDPFVMACQVSQVYYLSYPCKTIPDLLKWLVAYRVPPRGCVPSYGTTDGTNPPEPPTYDVSFYQEDGLEGTFTIDLGDGLENIMSCGSDEITDPKELEILEKQSAQEYVVDEESNEEDEESDDEDEESDEDDEPEVLAYDPNDF